MALQDLNSAIKSQPKLFLGSNDNGNVSQGNSGRHNQNVPVTQHTNKDTNDDMSHHNDTGSPLGQNGDVPIQSTATPRVEKKSRFGPNSGALHQNTGTPRGERVSRFGPDGASSFFRLRANTLERRSPGAAGERRILMKQLSRIVVMTSLEFSEALPFAAFASLLVEMVARLDNVIEEVEELGTVACFKEYDDNVVDRTDLEVRVEKPADLVVGVE